MKREELARVIESANRRITWDEALEIADAVTAAMGDETAELRARRKAPETSKIGTDRIKAGTVMDEVLYLIRVSTIGMTDDDLERKTGRSHQSVSAARNTLMRRGYVGATEKRRNTRYGNPAVVYAWTGKEVQR